MNGTTNPGWKSNPEPPYTSGKDGMPGRDYDRLQTAIKHLGLALDWIDELDEGISSADLAGRKIGEALDLLRSLI